ncbi:MAG TPA: ester cyclase, partial [Kribbella sp.]
YLESGDWTISRFQGQGVNDGPLGDLPATGRQLDLPFCELVRWQDDKSMEVAIYYDTGSIMVQLGHMDPPA